MRITSRDSEILQKVHECLWLSTSQLKRYFFKDTSLRAINKRLHLLVSANYLACKRRSLIDEYYFRIGVKGKIKLLNNTQINPENIRIPKKLPKQLNHFSILNDIRWYAEQSIMKRGGSFDFFFIDRELKALFGMMLVIPDSVFGFKISNKKQRILFIEYDANTENPQFFGRDKVQRYHKALETKKGLWASSELKVLIVADNRRRINQLIKHSIKYLKQDLQFFFCSMEDIKKSEDLFAEICVNPLEVARLGEFKACSCLS